MQHLTVLIRQLDRITSLVNSVLDAASLDDGRMVLDRQPVDLRELVARAATSWREARRDVVIDVALPREPIVASVDEERMRQILDNLLSNAVKYAGAAPINVSVETATRSASIVVRDNGPGIPAAELPHLFDRFRRAEGHGRIHGHGLGLYVLLHTQFATSWEPG
jgi:signal transduction histidine kinase